MKLTQKKLSGAVKGMDTLLNILRGPCRISVIKICRSICRRNCASAKDEERGWEELGGEILHRKLPKNLNLHSILCYHILCADSERCSVSVRFVPCIIILIRLYSEANSGLEYRTTRPCRNRQLTDLKRNAHLEWEHCSCCFPRTPQ
jgi:hypothetical protein